MHIVAAHNAEIAETGVTGQINVIDTYHNKTLIINIKPIFNFAIKPFLIIISQCNCTVKLIFQIEHDFLTAIQTNISS